MQKMAPGAAGLNALFSASADSTRRVDLVSWWSGGRSLVARIRAIGGGPLLRQTDAPIVRDQLDVVGQMTSLDPDDPL
jgi:hypothetical protein